MPRARELAEADSPDGLSEARLRSERLERSAKNRPQLSQEDRRKRLALVESLLVQGASQAAVERELGSKFQTGKKLAAALVQRVHARWAEEERQTRPFWKSAQLRRLLSEIGAAKRGSPAKVVDGAVVEPAHPPNWGAVAQLERLVADLTGTREPIELKLDIDLRVSEALLHVVSGLTPEAVRELAERQRRLRAFAQADGSVLEVPVPDARASAG